MADMASEEIVLLAALSPRPNQQNITLAASTGQYSDAVIRVGDEYQVSSERLRPSVTPSLLASTSRGLCMKA